MHLAAVIVCGTVLTLACSANAATYYVSPQGSDLNPGSSARPFLSIQKGADSARAGDTVIVEDGAYGPSASSRCGNGRGYVVSINRAGSPDAPITLKAAHKWGATIDGQDICHSPVNLGPGAAHWIIQDFIITSGCWSGIFSNSGASYITVKGNHFLDIGRRQESSPYGITGAYANSSSHDLVYEGNLFHDIGRTGGLPSQPGNDHGLYLHSSRTVIVNNVFYQTIAGWPIQTASGFSGLIANNTFSGPHSSKEGHIMLWGLNSDVVIRNNIFDNPRNYAVVFCNALLSGENSFDHNLAYGVRGFNGGDQCIGSAVTGTLVQSANTIDDPRLVNRAAHDFHLKPDSEAIGRGVPVPEVYEDFDRNSRPQGAACDIGAFEFIPDAETSMRRQQ